MSDAAIPFELLSADQFLERRPLTHRVELADGVIYNMSGGTVQHNQIAMNAVLALGFAARNLGCLLVSNDVALRVGPSTIYYPDVMAVCDVSDDDTLSRTNPCFIIEVVSPSSARVDHREKRIAYQAIASMRDYLIVDPDAQKVDHHHRENADAWSWSVRHRGEFCATDCLGVLAVDDLFVGL
jgi:Uma2 family endonuclease